MTAAVLPLDASAVAALRADLAAWTYEATDAVLGTEAQGALLREHRVPALVVTREVSAPGAVPGTTVGLDAATHRRVALLIRLFLLGDALTREEAGVALARLGVDRAVAGGLVAAGPDGTVRGLVDIRPLEGAWLVSDLGQTATGQPLRADHVLGAGGASYALARMTVRRPVARVLDVGTGAGIQALLASRHAEHIVATDLSARALALADLTLRLAGLTPGNDYELRTGSMLEPAAGEEYDLVVSNPPFVITPDAVRDAGTGERPTGGLGLMEYRDGGRRGDELVADLARTVAAPDGGVLAPGGIAQFLGNWELAAGEDWRERVGSWIPDGVDAWVVQREVLEPAAYVETWLRDGGMTPEADRETFEAAYALWLADFHRRGITGIGMGTVTLRRPERPLGSGEPAWRRFEEITTSATSPGAADVLGRHIGDVLDVVAALRELGVDPNAGGPDGGGPGGAPVTPEAVAVLADQRFVVAGDVTEERHYRPGAADPNLVTLHQGGGYGRNRRVDTLTAAFVGASDGALTLGQIAGALAALLGGGDEETITTQLAAQAVDLLIEGFLTR